MAEFLADIAGMLEIFAIAAGLVFLHRASKEAPARLLRAAGFVLLIGGITIGLCTGYYWFKYQTQGEFQHATMGQGQMMPGEPMRGPHMTDPPGQTGR